MICALVCCLLFVAQSSVSFAQDGFYVIATSSFRYRGNFQNNVAYNVGDIVFQNSSSWVCLKYNNTNHDPSDSPNYWGELLRAFKHKGNFARNTQYNAGDIVFENGASWMCIKENNTNHDPHDSPSYWGKLAINGKDGAQGPAGPAGPAVHTSAVCASAGQKINGTCSCAGTLVSKVTAPPHSSCKVTSDTGSCTASGSTYEGSYDYGTFGECCVCAP